MRHSNLVSFNEAYRNPIFVFGLYLNGIDILREFRERKIECIGIDCYDSAPGLLIKNTPTFVCPDPEENESAWIEFIIKLRKKFKSKPVLMVASDKFILPIQKNRDELEELFYFNSPDGNIFQKFLSKKELYNLARKNGMPVPFTFSINNLENLYDNLDKIKYPCLIKPEYSFKWRSPQLVPIIGFKKVLRIENEKQLLYWYKKVSRYCKDLLIQEIIPGPDENSLYFCSYIGKNKECLGYYCGKKLRITPIHFGSASFVEIIDPSPIKDLCLNLLLTNNYWGPSGIEMKKDERDGVYKLVEINPRFGLWDILGKKVGIDIFYLAYEDLIGRDIKTLSPLPKRYYWLSLTRDIPAFMQYRKEKSTNFTKWFGSLFGRVYVADIYFDERSVMFNLYAKRLWKRFREILGNFLR